MFRKHLYLQKLCVESLISPAGSIHFLEFLTLRHALTCNHFISAVLIIDNVVKLTWFVTIRWILEVIHTVLSPLLRPKFLPKYFRWFVWQNLEFPTRIVRLIKLYVSLIFYWKSSFFPDLFLSCCLWWCNNSW